MRLDSVAVYSGETPIQRKENTYFPLSPGHVPSMLNQETKSKKDGTGQEGPKGMTPFPDALSAQP